MYWSTALGSLKMTIWAIHGKNISAFTTRIGHPSIDLAAGLPTIPSKQAEIAYNAILRSVQNGFRDGKTSRKTIILSMDESIKLRVVMHRNIYDETNCIFL